MFIGAVKFKEKSIDLLLENPNEKVCAECMKPLDKGDQVVMFSRSTVEDPGSNVILISLNENYVVHVKGKENGSCLEDFVARVIANSPMVSLQKPSGSQ